MDLGKLPLAAREAWAWILRHVARSDRSPSSATIFREAERHRAEGRYDEAAKLVADGLERAPDSGAGHLLAGYLNLARGETDQAKIAFRRLLALDPYHPRALLALARIALEEGDMGGANALLDRALTFYPDFPEARSLRDSALQPVRSTPTTARRAAPDLALDAGARDIVVTRSSGSLFGARVDRERQRLIAHHAAEAARMASALLACAGFGPLRRAAIETARGTTFLLDSGRGEVMSATLDEPVKLAAGFARVERLRSALAQRHGG